MTSNGPVGPCLNEEDRLARKRSSLRAARKKYYLAHPEVQRAWVNKNREKVHSYAARHRAAKMASPDAVARREAYRLNQIAWAERRSAIDKQRLDKKAAWDAAAPEREVARRERKRIAKQALRKTPRFKVVRAARRRLRKIVKEKSRSVWHNDFIGCTPEFLCAHLAQNFKDGMSWDNYGQWHIDHIRPCAAFDLTNEDQCRLCFHYSNLQPLWANENIAKGASVK